MNGERCEPVSAGLKKRNRIIWYGILLVSLLGLGGCTALLFPQVREMFIEMTQRYVFSQKLKPHHIVEAREILEIVAAGGIFFIVIFDFLALTGPGKFLLTKAGFIDIHKAQLLDMGKSFLQNRIFNRPFDLFVFFTGFFVLMVCVSRAANTGITYDEASTYFDLVYPGILEALMRSQYLNNHILNSLLIRFVCFITQTKFNEFFIRLPSILSYCVYIIFAYRIARKSNFQYFIFILFIANYYLNEFFGLARGYGMAAACILAALYYFENWKKNTDNAFFFHCFMIWCSLAALANGIALYTIFSVLVIITFKYRRNIVKLSNSIYLFIFLMVALFVILMSRPGKSLASADSFYVSIISAVFGSFAQSPYLMFAGFAAFIGALIYGLVKTKYKNDYGLIYIIFISICFISNVIFRRGYPNSREMIPFYPVMVFVVADALKYMKSGILPKFLFTSISAVLCVQFMLQINIESIKSWGDDYKIRNEILVYALTNDIAGSGKVEFQKFIDSYHNPVARFYAQKLDLAINE
ncbi:MAG: hypothetical protein LBK13_11455 [Spirochaetales bacterium]|jgi:hypothetical protein|nr:hypothetical protein [Spirochaetales bacterium]